MAKRCKCAKYTEEIGVYNCTIINEECYFSEPDSRRCAEMYNQGPDVSNEELIEDIIEQEEEIFEDEILDEIFDDSESEYVSEDDELDDITE